MFKTEMFCKCKWDGTTLDEFERSASIRYIVRYNTTRHKCSLKGVSPMEFRKALGLALAA
ncbi:IS3 family transposase [Atopobium sp. oral taxon 416]|uniref:IS3 family transposase n=1 Tax=Atopobium sp. oral taxon 416 TaxID=712157 RepID=UPI001BAAB80C|nr:IS3 family transposase [Atopobium sp. oral taxon 416]QUC02249.1 IS3 family transposase [Atopobium sp. oral taxon 416]